MPLLRDMQPPSDMPYTGEITRIASSGGDSIAVQRSNGLGLPIVFLHDIKMGGKEQYGKLLQGSLGRKHAIYCIDFPGHGSSSKALFPKAAYTMDGLANVVRDVLKHLRITSAIFVGSGLGAYLLGHMMPELATISQGFIMCDLGTPGSEAAGKSVGDTWWIEPADALQVKINATEQPVGIIDRAADAELVALLNPNVLWRNAVQVVPGVSSHVAEDHPDSFEMLVRAFIHDILGRPVVERDDPAPMPSEHPNSRVTPSPSARLTRHKSTPGTMPNPMARYEVVDEDDNEGDGSKLEPRSSSNMTNPNRRGKVMPGTMPHPAARFDYVPDEEPEEENPASAAYMARHQSNENVRGRIAPGTMPHPAMRFELAVTDHTPEPQDAGAQDDGAGSDTSSLSRRGTHANSRGRIIPGTMPHPASRFELPADQDPSEEKSRLARHYSQEIMRANPNAKGRVVGGTMPHPASRFESTSDSGAQPAGTHLKGGSLPHPDLRFHTGPSQIGDMPSTRVVQPPGGFSNNIFG